MIISHARATRSTRRQKCKLNSDAPRKASSKAAPRPIGIASRKNERTAAMLSVSAPTTKLVPSGNRIAFKRNVLFAELSS